jgi:hypothetical protein
MPQGSVFFETAVAPDAPAARTSVVPQVVGSLVPGKRTVTPPLDVALIPRFRESDGAVTLTVTRSRAWNPVARITIGSLDAIHTWGRAAP